MKIVGVTACTAGIAHTYIVAQKIKDAAEAAGHECKIETQGSIGADNVLTPEEIEAADVVIIAHDIEVPKDRFKDKRVMEVPTSVVLKASKQIINKIEESLNA